MRVTTLHAPGDIRLEDKPAPTIQARTDAIVQTVATCICGSDLWPYRGADDFEPGRLIGHEVVGVVQEVGASVTVVGPGDFVVVPFCHCDNTCPHCQAGVTSACTSTAFTTGGQADYVRVTQAQGTLVATDGPPDEALIPSLLALADVMATGWHAAVAAKVSPGSTAVVVGDGAVGLCGVLAARQLGAERIVAMSRHQDRQRLARTFGATDIVAERGEAGQQQVLDITRGIGADAVLECVGTGLSMATAVAVARPGATVGIVGAPHGVDVPIGQLFARNVGIAGGIAPVRAYLPQLLELVQAGQIEPGLVFDVTQPLDEVAEGYRRMDQREAIKVLLTP